MSNPRRLVLLRANTPVAPFVWIGFKAEMISARHKIKSAPMSFTWNVFFRGF